MLPKNTWIVLIAAFVIGSGIVLKQFVFIVWLIGFLIFASFSFFPQLVIPLLLVVRSSLDVFTDMGFYIGTLWINIPSITSLFLLIGGAFYIVFRLAAKKGLYLDRIGRTFLAYLTFLLFWVFIAYNNFGAAGLTGLREWIRLASLCMIYLLVYQLSAWIGYKKNINYIFWALLVPMTVAIYQVITSAGVNIFGVNRVFGTLAHPNYFSLFLTLFIGITLWKIRFSKARYLWIFLLLLELFILINTFSIGGFVMFLIMSFMLLCSILKETNRVALLFIVAVAIIGFLVSPAGHKRIDREILKFDAARYMTAKWDIADENSLSWRISNWYLLLKEYKNRPLLGYGLHTTGELVNPLRMEAHSDYLRFLVDTGLIGFILFISFLAILGRELRKRLRSLMAGKDVKLSYLTLICFSVYCAWIIGSLTDNYITATGFQYYFWALLGIIMGAKEDNT